MNPPSVRACISYVVGCVCVFIRCGTDQLAVCARYLLIKYNICNQLPRNKGKTSHTNTNKSVFDQCSQTIAYTCRMMFLLFHFNFMQFELNQISKRKSQRTKTETEEG